MDLLGIFLHMKQCKGSFSPFLNMNYTMGHVCSEIWQIRVVFLSFVNTYNMSSLTEKLFFTHSMIFCLLKLFLSIRSCRLELPLHWFLLLLRFYFVLLFTCYIKLLSSLFRRVFHVPKKVKNIFV